MPPVVEGFETVNGEFHSRCQEWEDYKYDGDYVYQTSDGEIFTEFDKAKSHEETIDVPEMKEVEDLLNKAILVCKNYKGTNVYLSNVKDVLQKTIKDGGSYMLDKYYDSTCY